MAGRTTFWVLMLGVVIPVGGGVVALLLGASLRIVINPNLLPKPTPVESSAVTPVSDMAPDAASDAASDAVTPLGTP